MLSFPHRRNGYSTKFQKTSECVWERFMSGPIVRDPNQITSYEHFVVAMIPSVLILEFGALFVLFDSCTLAPPRFRSVSKLPRGLHCRNEVVLDTIS